MEIIPTNGNNLTEQFLASQALQDAAIINNSNRIDTLEADGDRYSPNQNVDIGSNPAFNSVQVDGQLIGNELIVAHSTSRAVALKCAFRYQYGLAGCFRAI